MSRGHRGKVPSQLLFAGQSIASERVRGPIAVETSSSELNKPNYSRADISLGFGKFYKSPSKLWEFKMPQNKFLP